MVQENNLSSQCDIEMKLMPSSNCSVNKFETLSHVQLACYITS